MTIQSVSGVLGTPPAPRASSEPVSEPAVNADAAAEEKDVPGVIRNLQAGKYKGVADVRLRIVQADKLAALEAESIRAELDGAAAQLSSALRPLVDELTAPPPAPEGDESEVTEAAADAAPAADPLESFAASIDAAIAGDIESFSTAARDAFATLIASLDLAPAAPEEGEPAAAEGIEPAADEGADAVIAEAPRDYLTELTAAFEASLSALVESATAASALPPLSEPSGKGVAYDKFLAMYLENQGTDSTADEPAAAAETPESIDTAI